MQLKDSDIIVSGTDGVFDNLFTHEILTIVSEYRSIHKLLWKESQAHELSKIIVDAAKSKFNQSGQKTPYQRKFKKTFNTIWEKGGKEDDITVVVTFCRAVRKTQ